ncbi:cupin domain-containing protein [Methylocystis sp. ATCC 49242]|uniref:cupin domain-containing protein n=1 Tax=Methylocystis sp. ATCC 49242 TaxID=622637 RepID=UPI0002D74E79|nr:cupin domain-containing protein [Methylocystis sp. ATCC 49242]
MTSETGDRPTVAMAREIAPRSRRSVYPEPFAALMDRREKRALGDFFGLTNFGVNLTTIAPGGQSALLHRHSRQDEFVYILEGAPTLVLEDREIALQAGMCAGFPARGAAHCLVNRTDATVVYLEIGDRAAGDEASYPNDDLKAAMGEDGRWIFTHRDGRPYE